MFFDSGSICCVCHRLVQNEVDDPDVAVNPIEKCPRCNQEGPQQTPEYEKRVFEYQKFVGEEQLI